jgi:hypothetical protein
MNNNFCLSYTTPDSHQDTEEFFEDVESCQRRKDQIMAMPRLTTNGLLFSASDSEGNEIDLK